MIFNSQFSLQVSVTGYHERQGEARGESNLQFIKSRHTRDKDIEAIFQVLFDSPEDLEFVTKNIQGRLKTLVERDDQVWVEIGKEGDEYINRD